MISPTFQANNVISLKDELFKDDKNGKGYVEVNLNLREVAKKDPVEINQNDFEGNGQKPLKEYEIEQLRKERKRLIEHYQKEPYWKKIRKLFKQENADAVLAWEDSIMHYKTVKEAKEKAQQESNRLR